MLWREIARDIAKIVQKARRPRVLASGGYEA